MCPRNLRAIKRAYLLQLVRSRSDCNMMMTLPSVLLQELAQALTLVVHTDMQNARALERIKPFFDSNRCIPLRRITLYRIHVMNQSPDRSDSFTLQPQLLFAHVTIPFLALSQA